MEPKPGPKKPAVVTPTKVAPPVKPSPSVEPSPAPVTPGPAKVIWANVVATKDCFFFSGPFEHGRDATVGSTATLEMHGEKAVLRLGEVSFDGSGIEGLYHFQREDEREFEGKWRSTERIEAELSSQGLRGSYAYEECDLEGNQGCPGDCTIRADFFARGLTMEDTPSAPAR